MRALKAIKLTAAAAVIGAFTTGSYTANALVITTNCAAADRCTLDELFNNAGAIQVDDKLFSDWALEPTNPFSVVPDFSLVEVVGLDDGGLDPGPGLLFNGNGELSVAVDPNTGDSQFLELAFNFQVTVLGPALSIVDNSLSILDFTVAGDGAITIDEAVFGAGLINLGNKHVEVHGEFPGTDILFDAIEFPPQQTLLIEKTIHLDAGFDGAAELIAFEQRFSQVPEPAALALFGIGLGGLAGWRRRKSGVSL